MLVNFKTKKYSCTVHMETGDIVAYKKDSKINTNIKNKVNTFPHTDEDFIILDGRATLEQALDNMENK